MGSSAPKEEQTGSATTTNDQPSSTTNPSDTTGSCTVDSTSPAQIEDELLEDPQDPAAAKMLGSLQLAGEDKAKFEELIQSLSTSIHAAESELQSNLEKYKDIKGIPQLQEKVHQLGNAFQSELVSFLKEAERPLRAALVGPSNYGKSTLKEALKGDNTQGLETTTNPEWCKVSPSLEILDTFGMVPTQSYPSDKLQILRKEVAAKPPDVVLMFADLTQVRNWPYYQKSMIQIYEEICTDRPGIPVFWVGTKLDAVTDYEYGKDGDETWNAWIARADHAYTEIHAYYCKKFSEVFSPFFTAENLYITSITKKGNFRVTGEGGLYDCICANAPLWAQLYRPGINRYIQLRRIIAVKIIAIFSSINFVVGALPVIDIIVTPMVDWIMVNTLQHLRTNPDKTADVYRTTYYIRAAFNTTIRTAILTSTLLLDLSLVFAVVGAAVGAAVSAVHTTVLGYHAYNFFTEGSEEWK